MLYARQGFTTLDMEERRHKLWWHGVGGVGVIVKEELYEIIEVNKVDGSYVSF